jgi:phytoene dehydrogenase-like protein
MKSLILGSSPNAFSAALTLAEAGHQVEMVEIATHLGAPYYTLEGGEVGLADLHFCSQLSQRFQLNLPSLHHTGRTALRSDGSFVRMTRPQLEGVHPSQDAERWPEFVQLLDQTSALIGQVLHNPQAPQDLPEQWRALGRRPSLEVLRLPWMSLRDLLDEWFLDEALKGMLAEVALEGVAQGPFASGTAFHLLRRWNRGDALAPATAPGGSSALIAALHQAATQKGVRLHHLAGPARVEGQQLNLAGEVLTFDHLLSDKDVRWTYTQLISPRHLETEFNTAIHRVRGRGVWQRVLGRGAWPANWPESSQRDIVHLHPGLRQLERNYDRLKRNQPVDGPVQVCWPHFVDPSRPELLVQATLGYGGGSLPTGIPVDTTWGPADYEQHWQCPQGHLWGGAVDLSQSFFLRPIPAYEAELPDVDLCGASLHPGDYSGRSGLWAAQKVIQALAAS